MNATYRGVLWILSTILLGGCGATGLQNQPTATPTASFSLGVEKAPPRPPKAITVIGRNWVGMLEVMQRFNDQGCADGRPGESCSLDRRELGRLAGIMQTELDAAAPGVGEVSKLAEKTASRLAAVAVLADDSYPASSLYMELTLLKKDLDSWRPYLEAERQVPADNR